MEEREREREGKKKGERGFNGGNEYMIFLHRIQEHFMAIGFNGENEYMIFLHRIQEHFMAMSPQFRS